MNVLSVPCTFGLCSPKHGGQHRFLKLVKELTARGNHVTVLEQRSVTTPHDAAIATVYTYADHKVFGRRLSFFRDVDPFFISALAKVLRDRNIQVAEFTYPSGMFAFKLLARAMNREIKTVYAPHDVQSDFISSCFVGNPIHSELEHILIPPYIRLLERIVCKHLAEHVTAVSAKDKSTLVNKYKLESTRVTVVPSGARLREEQILAPRSGIKKRYGLDPGNVVVIFHGSYTHPPNRDAFDRITAFVAPQFETIDKRVVFVLAGTDAPVWARPNIKMIGQVDNLGDLFAIADIAVVPLKYGQGTKLKVLDYLGAGLAIVTTTQGVEGLDIEDGKHAIIVRQVDGEFVGAIKHLVDDVETRRRLGSNARQLAEEKYSWHSIGDTLDSLYRRLAGDAAHG